MSRNLQTESFRICERVLDCCVVENWTRFKYSTSAAAYRCGKSRNGRFGPVAVIRANSSSMTALGRKADIQPGRMTAFTVTGHSEALKRADLNDR
jgi:hypothetical protein